MPRYYREHTTKLYKKECSCCGEVTVGTTDLQESLVIFSSIFAESNGSAQAADNFQSRCWICNQSKRRWLGVTRHQLERMLQEQDYKCAICTQELSIARNALPINKANVDHDEASGEIRGLLCGHCNRGIGLFFHRPEVLQRAAVYCEQAERVIRLKRDSNG